MAKPSWDALARLDEADRPYLEKHGLAKPLWHDKLRTQSDRAGYNWWEIERQIDYLLAHLDQFPPTVVNRRAALLLSCYGVARKPIPPNMPFLIGQLLDVSAVEIKYAKKPHSLLHARDYVKEHPDASNGAIARAVGVDKSTVGRWRKKDLF